MRLPTFREEFARLTAADALAKAAGRPAWRPCDDDPDPGARGPCRPRRRCVSETRTKPENITKAVGIVSREAEEGPLTKAARQAAFQPCLACPNEVGCRLHNTCAAEISGIAKSRTMSGAAFLATGAEARRRIAADPRLAARRPLPRHWAPPSVPKD